MKKTRPFHYRVDFVEEKIKISNSFATAAQKANTSAHKQLMDLRKAYHGFGIQVHKTHITPTKQKYKGLGFDEMRRCIIEWDGEGSVNLATLNKAITDKVPYPKVKQWYLGIYGEHYTRATDVSMPTEEDAAAVGITDTAVATC